MVDPKDSGPSAEPVPSPTLTERTPFAIKSIAELENWLREHFPDSPEGAAALEAALKQEDEDLRQRFLAAGWKLQDGAS